MSRALVDFLRTEANNLEQAGLLRKERPVELGRGATVSLGKKELLNFCSSDYLGLSNHPEVKSAAKAAIDVFGAGLSSSRMVAGTLPLHGELEREVSKLLGTDETLVFPSGYHAATGVFESLLSDKDYLICDARLAPNLADGVKLCRARVFQYRSGDLADLEDRLRRSRVARFRVVVTDGVFPMDGTLAPLAGICALAEKYEAIVVVEDGQGVGVLGAQGRGTAELLGLSAQVTLTVGDFGHALGGGEGGFVSGRKELIAWLRQKARPHLTSTALSPAATAGALEALRLAGAGGVLRRQLSENARAFSEALTVQGFQVLESAHPTVSVLLGDAVATQRMADLLLRKGVYAMGFCHPVVPEGAARIRALVTVRHNADELRAAAGTFGVAARELRLLPSKP